MKIKKYIRIICAAFIFAGCGAKYGAVNVDLIVPSIKELGIFNVENFEWKLMVSCTGEDMAPVIHEINIDYLNNTGPYEVSMTVPIGRARHFSAMIYAVGPDPTRHPKTYFLAGDGGLVDLKESEFTVELNMLYLWQYGDSNIYIDSEDRVWFSITPLYQYAGGDHKQFQLVTQGGIGFFDGVQFNFVSLDSFLLDRGLDFSQSGLSFTAMDGNDNVIFLGTTHGVFVFDIQSMQFVDFFDVDSGKIPLQNSDDDYVIQVMVKRFPEGAGSEVWFLMTGGIVVHNFTNGSFYVIQGTQGNSYHFVSEDPFSPYVYAGKYRDATIGYDYNLSVYGWNSLTSSWELSAVYLPNTEVLTLFTDSSGTKWLSASGLQQSNEFLLLSSRPDFTQEASFDLVGQNGLNLNGINYPSFSFNVSDINSYGNLLYFGSNAGLIIFDKQLNEWNLLERINSYLFDNYVRGIRITSYGDAWFTAGLFPTVLPAGVKTGGRETMHPDNSRAVDSIQITNDASWIPYGIAISPDGLKVYAGVQNYSDTLGWIAEIDTTSKSVNPIPLNTTASPYYVRLSPDGTKLYASDLPNQKLWVVDLATKSPVPYLTNPTFGPFKFKVSADGTKGYFLNDTAQTYSIKILDLVSNLGQEIGEIQMLTASSVRDMVITSDETAAYISDNIGNKIFRVDLVNKTATEFLVFQPDQFGMAFSPEMLLLDEKNNQLISVGLYMDSYHLVDIPISDPSKYYISSIYLPATVFDMLLTVDASMLFLTFNWADYFYVIDANDLNIIRTSSSFINTGFSGGPMVISPDGKAVYVITGQYLVGYQLNLESIR